MSCILQTKMNTRVDHMIEFGEFSNSEMNVTNSYSDRSRWKNGVIYCPVSMFPFWVMALKMSKKIFFWNFVLTSARNLSLLKQFTYMHLKGLLTRVQEMVLFIMLWLTWKSLLNICWVSIFSYVLIANNS